MTRPAARIHRLPRRLDYTLIPAPLDLSLPLATEKSSLPAIIVTPSSPSSSRDFSIAFLAPPPKPSIRDRISSYTLPVKTPFQLKTRTTLIVFLIIFILLCHMVTHRLAANRPRLDFAIQGGDGDDVGSPWGSWFDFRSLWGSSIRDDKLDFVITEIPKPA